MTKVLAFLKSCFDALKSWLDYSTRRNELRSKTTDNNVDGMKAIDKSEPKREPWIVISNDKIEVYKD